MERRDFLKKMLFSGTLFLCGGAKEAFAQASKEMLHHQITGKKAKKKERSWRIVKVIAPPIKEMHLQFCQPLIRRKSTDFIVIHHIGGTNRDVSAQEVHRWHLANGWAGIGYHYVIRKDGTIERGRPRDMVGAHCYGYNKNSLGINIVGEVSTPTKAQLASAVQLAAYLCQLYQLKYAQRCVIYGHRELDKTFCPGKNMYAQLDSFRQNVFSLLNN